MSRKVIALVLGISFLCLCLLAAVGCARKSKTVSSDLSDTQSTGAQVGGGNDLGSDALQERLARELDFRAENEKFRTIYFDYDSAALKPQATGTLEQAVDALKQNPQIYVQVEGHCDERGTDEYNLALGERRALSAKRYLVSLGVDPNRILTISYGEERPAAEGHDESAWQYNRRDEFRVAN